MHYGSYFGGNKVFTFKRQKLFSFKILAILCFFLNYFYNVTLFVCMFTVEKTRKYLL